MRQRWAPPAYHGVRSGEGLGEMLSFEDIDTDSLVWLSLPTQPGPLKWLEVRMLCCSGSPAQMEIYDSQASRD